MVKQQMITKVLIVDDHPAIREGLAGHIRSQPNMEVCGQAADTADAMRLVAENHPDVVVVDIQLESGNGLDLVRRIKSCNASIGILVWSMYPDDTYAHRALRAGALGYVNKRHATSQIVEAIHRVRDGRIYLCEGTAERLLSTSLTGATPVKAPVVECLSDRQLEVFRLIGQGLTTSQIAAQLHRSVNTIESHRSTIKDKLGLATAGDLSRIAVQWMLENG